MWEQITITGFADEISPKLDNQMEVLCKLGISYMEIRGVDGQNLIQYPIHEVKNIKSRLDAKGISISALGSSIGKIGIRDDFAPHMELYKHTVEVAHVMKTPNIRMFSFYIPKEEEAAACKEEVMERLGQLVDYAKSNDIVLLHENEKGIYGEKADGCLDIMKNFYGEHMKAVFDFANFIQAHQNTLEAFKILKPYIGYVHIKDAMWADGTVVPSGYGDGQVKEILKQLKDSGYQGYLSLEPHLANFTGFASLEQGGVIEKKMSGEDAFTLAYDSLVKILEEI